MARREAKTQEKKVRAKAQTTPPLSPQPARPKGSRKAARAEKLEIRREEKFERNGVKLVEPKYKSDRWKVLARGTLIGEPYTRRNALKKAHQFCQRWGR